MWDLRSPTRDRTHAPCIGSAESKPLDCQVSPADFVVVVSKPASYTLGVFRNFENKRKINVCPSGLSRERYKCPSLATELSRGRCVAWTLLPFLS